MVAMERATLDAVHTFQNGFFLKTAIFSESTTQHNMDSYASIERYERGMLIVRSITLDTDDGVQEESGAAHLHKIFLGSFSLFHRTRTTRGSSKLFAV
ncbi:unnamed protein product [Phytomonas sp. EM1]|nr:unnamed protein product [Phytomonas sp. EM1]|eukprot:CCW61601.1 unnamed protein product [Phytomonas sp. isolate EM1]